jgi:hypothetical protein
MFSLVPRQALYASIKSSRQQNRGVSGARATELSTPDNLSNWKCVQEVKKSWNFLSSIMRVKICESGYWRKSNYLLSFQEASPVIMHFTTNELFLCYPKSNIPNQINRIWYSTWEKDEMKEKILRSLFNMFKIRERLRIYRYSKWNKVFIC